jgi:hypothetical protein
MVPMVFISYSHDSPEHEARVLEFTNRLRRDRVDAVLDQYESFPPAGWIGWMDEQVERAKFVLMVFTEGYGTGRVALTSANSYSKLSITNVE